MSTKKLSNEESSKAIASSIPEESGTSNAQEETSPICHRKKHPLLFFTFITAFVVAALCPVLSASNHNSQIQSLLSAARSGTVDEKTKSIALLRSLATDTDLSSEGNGGLNLAGQQDRELFFKITGKIPDEKTSATPYYQRSLMGGNLVGPKTKGLCLTSSKIGANIDSATLTSSIEWTMIFRNRGLSNAEARFEMGLPEGAVVSQAILWMNGKPKEAVVAEYGTARAAYQSVVQRGLDPLLITMSSKNRLFVQCFPVLPSGAEMTIKISMNAPLSLGSTNGVLHLPRIVDSNFLEAKNCFISVFSKGPILSSNHDECTKGKNGYCIDRKEKHTNNGASPVSYSLPLAPNRKAIVVQAPSERGAKRFIVERVISSLKPAPSRLYVVIDTSSLMKEHVGLLKSAISNMPESLHPSICFIQESKPTARATASSESPLPEILDRRTAIASINREEFIGGKDNGPVLREVLEKASEHEGSTVLWLHGPQPMMEEPERFLEFDHAVRLWDFQVEPGSNPVVQSLHDEHLGNRLELNFLKPKDKDAEGALQELIDSWKFPGKIGVNALSFCTSAQIPHNATFVGDLPLTKQVESLWANGEVERLLANSSQTEAESIACNYHIVTPVTAAVVLEREEDYKRFSLNSAPSDGPYGSVSDTYRGLHQWFKDDLVGNLFSNIGQLVGKWLSEAIEIMAGLIEQLIQLTTSSSLYPLGSAPVVYSVVCCCIVQILLAPIILFFYGKVSPGEPRIRLFAKESPFAVIAIGRFLALTVGYALLCALVIDFSAPVCLWLFQIDAHQLQALDFAIGQAVRGGIIQAGAGATSVLAPLLANLAIPVAGQYVGQWYYFSAMMLWALVVVLIVVELTVILAILFSRLIMLGLQYVVGPLLISLSPNAIGRTLIRTLAELELWTVGWFGALKLLSLIASSFLSPWVKCILVAGILFLIIWLTKTIVLRRLYPPVPAEPIGASPATQ